jgi:hypothetical protein
MLNRFIRNPKPMSQLSCTVCVLILLWSANKKTQTTVLVEGADNWRCRVRLGYKAGFDNEPR